MISNRALLRTAGMSRKPGRRRTRSSRNLLPHHEPMIRSGRRATTSSAVTIRPLAASDIARSAKMVDPAGDKDQLRHPADAADQRVIPLLAKGRPPDLAVYSRDEERRVLSEVTAVGGARRFHRFRSVAAPLPVEPRPLLLSSQLNLLGNAERVVDPRSRDSGPCFRAWYARGAVGRLAGCPSSCRSGPPSSAASNACRRRSCRAQHSRPRHGGRGWPDDSCSER